jgi:2-polyprenyl-6-methoxyphenol hydroxylase-like FAD-dependent oxidoreductase
MLGLLLARKGIDVLVLEKHGDFLRDFRGDTLHPSTLRIMDELGLADRLLERPHSKVDRLEVPTPSGSVAVTTSAVSTHGFLSSRSCPNGTSSTSLRERRGDIRAFIC